MLDGAVLSRQNTVQLMFAFRLEDDVDEDRDNDEEAGQGHNQPRGHGVCWQQSEVAERIPSSVVGSAGVVQVVILVLQLWNDEPALQQHAFVLPLHHPACSVFLLLKFFKQDLRGDSARCLTIRTCRTSDETILKCGMY